MGSVTIPPGAAAQLREVIWHVAGDAATRETMSDPGILHDAPRGESAAETGRLGRTAVKCHDGPAAGLDDRQRYHAMVNDRVFRATPTRTHRRDRRLTSVLTPTTLHPSRIQYLLQLYRALAAADVDWEWVLAVDGGHDRAVPDEIVADRRVVIIRTGRSVGAAGARNLALGIAHGEYIASADDDDYLPPASLQTRIAAAERYRCDWVAGRLADLRDGELADWKSPLPAGPHEPGDVWRTWSCPCLPFPLAPTTLLVEAELIRSIGGWQGLPQAEDFGMVLAVTGSSPGVMLDDVVYAYRKHSGQMTSGPGFGMLEPLVRHITFERGRLLAGARIPHRLPDRVA